MSSSTVSRVWVNFASKVSPKTSPIDVRAYFNILSERKLHEIDPASSDTESTLYDLITAQTGRGHVPNTSIMSRGFRDALVSHVCDHYACQSIEEFDVLMCMNTTIKMKYEYLEHKGPPKPSGRGHKSRSAARNLVDEEVVTDDNSQYDLPSRRRRRRAYVNSIFHNLVLEVYDILKGKLRDEQPTFNGLPEHAQIWLRQKLPSELGIDRTDKSVNDCFAWAFERVEKEHKENSAQPDAELNTDYDAFESCYVKVRQLVSEVYDLLGQRLQLEKPNFNDFPEHTNVWLRQRLGLAESDPALISTCFYWAFRCVGKERGENAAQTNIPVELSEDYDRFKSSMMSIGGRVFTTKG